jgi:hypothetical protein
MIKMTYFTVSQSPTSRTVCNNCKRKIHKDEIRVFVKVYDLKEYYHLICYTPKLKQYIREKDIKNNLPEDLKPVFKLWLVNWNSNYFPLEYHILDVQDIQKKVPTTPSIHRRALLEVFKFLEFNEVITLSLVSKEFYGVTWEQELWRYYYIKDFKEDLQTDDWRKSYMNIYFNCCISCKIVPSKDNYYCCPLLKRILCKLCKGKSDYILYHKKFIRNTYKINPDLLNLRFGQGYVNKKVVYKFLFERALYSFRQAKKTEIFNKLQEDLGKDNEILQIIEKIDVRDMDFHLINFFSNTIVPKFDTSITQESYKKVFEYIRCGSFKKDKYIKVLSEIRKEFI